MTTRVIHSNVPVALVLQSENGYFAPLAKKLETDDLTVVYAEEPTCFGEQSDGKVSQFSAFVIDGAIGSRAITEALDHIDPRFIEDGGPILIICDEHLDDDNPLHDMRAVNIIQNTMNGRALRRFVAEAIDRYSIVSGLRQEIEKRTSAIGQIVQGTFQFKTRREAQNLATTLSLTCADPMPVAIGLTELFVNAIEHGCLQIGHNEKGLLIENGQLAAEIAKRQQSPAFRDHMATVEFRREENGLFFVIRDPGPGFDYLHYMADNGSHDKKHGRGIVMARGCFSELSYHGCGNEVHAVYCFNA